MSKGEGDRVEKELVALVKERPDASGMVTGHVRYLATNSTTRHVRCESENAVFGRAVNRTLAASGPV